MCRYKPRKFNYHKFYLSSAVPKKILIQFGKQMRKEREKQKISQEKLAERAELHRNYVGAVERGEKNISLINIEKIAKALQMETSDFFKKD